jgi:hypothetical protein
MVAPEELKRAMVASLRESSNRDEVHMFVVLGDTAGTGCMTTTTNTASGGDSVKK